MYLFFLLYSLSSIMVHKNRSGQFQGLLNYYSKKIIFFDVKTQPWAWVYQNFMLFPKKWIINIIIYLHACQSYLFRGQKTNIFVGK